MREEHARAEAHAPLMTGDPLEHGAEAQITDTGPRQQGLARTTLRNAGPVVWLLTFSAGISGLLFGYDTGVISSMLVSIKSDLSGRELTTADKSVITAVTSLLALIAAPTTGFFADRYGRRFVILIASVLFTAGALVQAAAMYVWVMVLGRAIVGIAIGLASCATPLYITELAPAELRGRLVTIQSLFITGGQVVAYGVGWLLAHQVSGWRLLVGIGAAPAILQALLITVMYETPRWLVQSTHLARARVVLLKIYGGLSAHDRDRVVNSVLGEIQEEIAAEAKVNKRYTGSETAWTTFTATWENLTTHPPHRRALTLACMLQAFQQLCGFNSLMYFSATIFQLVGFYNPIKISLIVAGTNFGMTFVAFAFIDFIGRRKMLLISVPFMILGLATCSFAFNFIDLYSKAPIGGEAAFHTTTYNDIDHWGRVLIVALVLYVGAYAIGLGCVPWQQSELFPLRVRSLGSGIATATNWSSNFVIGISFLPMINVLGASMTFATYAAVCVFGWLAVYRLYPETAGLELEGVGELLKDGYGVKESIERFKASKRKPG